MNKYHISFADSWHSRAQVIYQTWQVILITHWGWGYKMAGREQTLSGQPAHASPNLMSRACQAPLIGPVKLRPESQEESDSFPPEGKTGLGEPLPIANNKHEAKKSRMWSQTELLGFASLSDCCSAEWSTNEAVSPSLGNTCQTSTCFKVETVDTLGTKLTWSHGWQETYTFSLFPVRCVWVSAPQFLCTFFGDS